MKIFIASDLHGSAEYCRQMIKAFNSEQADKILLLGDILYHGPRNELPEDYSPKQVVELLQPVKNKILCVGGNCDADIDRVVLPFPLVSDLGLIVADGLNIYFAHGHREEPHLCKGDVYLTGHTHVALHEEHEGHFHLNPGSLSLPKEGSKRGYIVYENRKFTYKDLSGEVYDEIEIPEFNEVVEEEPKVEEPKKEMSAAPRPHIIRKKIVVRRR